MASVFSHITKTHIKPYARAKPLGHIPVPGITFKSIVFYLAAEVIVLLLENHNKGMVSQTDTQAKSNVKYLELLCAAERRRERNKCPKHRRLHWSIFQQ